MEIHHGKEYSTLRRATEALFWHSRIGATHTEPTRGDQETAKEIQSSRAAEKRRTANDRDRQSRPRQRRAKK